MGSYHSRNEGQFLHDQNFKFVVNSKEMFEKMNDCEAEIVDVRVAFEDDSARV
jgi:hypothetical protein